MAIQRIGNPASHESGSAQAAINLFNSTGVDWPVSGDTTVWDFGRHGLKLITSRVNIWK